jgi:hypothetical protein
MPIDDFHWIWSFGTYGAVRHDADTVKSSGFG